MAIEVALQNERGEILAIVHDSKNLLPRLLERSLADQPFVAQINWYGDTIFNHLQMPAFLSAWGTLTEMSQTPEEVSLVNQIGKLAERCESEVHLYLKFIGD